MKSTRTVSVVAFAFSALVAVGQEYPQELRDRWQGLVQAGKIDEAARLLADYNYQEGRRLAASGKLDDAFVRINLSMTAVQLPVTETVERYGVLGDILMLQRKPFDASIYYKSALDFLGTLAKPDAAMVSNLLCRKGSAEMAAKPDGASEAALADFTEAKRLTPSSDTARLGRARALRKSGRGADAAKELDELLADRPENGEAIVERAWLFASEKKWDAALSHFDKRSAMPGADDAVRYGRGVCLSRTQKFADALREFDAAARTYSDRTELWTEKSKAYRGLGRMPEALAAADRAVGLNPKGVEPRLLRAELRIESGITAGVADDMLHALRLAPRDADVARRAGALVTIAEKMKGRDIKTASIHYERSQAAYDDARRFMDWPKFPNALPHAGRALEFDPICWPALMIRGKAYFCMGKFDEAGADLALVILIYPNLLPRVQEAMKDLRTKIRIARQQDQAVAHWDKFMMDMAEDIRVNGSTCLVCGGRGHGQCKR